MQLMFERPPADCNYTLFLFKFMTPRHTKYPLPCFLNLFNFFLLYFSVPLHCFSYNDTDVDNFCFFLDLFYKPIIYLIKKKKPWYIYTYLYTLLYDTPVIYFTFFSNLPYF